MGLKVSKMYYNVKKIIGESYFNPIEFDGIKKERPLSINAKKP
jgi:hypothetical protein